MRRLAEACSFIFGQVSLDDAVVFRLLNVFLSLFSTRDSLVQAAAIRACSLVSDVQLGLTSKLFFKNPRIQKDFFLVVFDCVSQFPKQSDREKLCFPDGRISAFSALVFEVCCRSYRAPMRDSSVADDLRSTMQHSLCLDFMKLFRSRQLSALIF